MSTQKNVQIVKDFFAAMGRGDRQALLALSAEDIEWIIPGEGWPLAGTHRGHAGLTALLQEASESARNCHFLGPQNWRRPSGFDPSSRFQYRANTAV